MQHLKGNVMAQRAEQWNKLEFLFITELSHLGKRKYACKHMGNENKDHQNTFT